MTKRTVKQRAQFEYRMLLGDLAGLPRWILSKRNRFANSPDIPDGTKGLLLQALDEACEELQHALEQTRNARKSKSNEDIRSGPQVTHVAAPPWGPRRGDERLVE